MSADVRQASLLPDDGWYRRIGGSRAPVICRGAGAW